MSKSEDKFKNNDFQLLENEEVIEIVHPHLLAFYHTYAIWLLFGLVSLGIVIFSKIILEHFVPMDLKPLIDLINTFLGTAGITGRHIDSAAVLDDLDQMMLILAWWYFLVPFAGVVTFVKINISWFLLMITIGIMGTLLGILTGIPLLALALGMAASMVGIFFTEKYRKTHKFIITNFRLIMQAGLLKYQERQLFFSHLSDLALEQSLLGRLFDFGTLVPISQSGLGLGEDMSMLAAGISKDQAGVALAGGRMISVPRGQSAHSLFGVPQPRRIHYLLEQLIHYNEDVNHLRQIEKKLDRVKFMTNDEQGENK